MSDTCENVLSCCPEDVLSYSTEDAQEQLMITTLVDPLDSGMVSGAGLYDRGATASLASIPSLPVDQDVGVDLVFALDRTGTMSDGIQLMDDLTDQLEELLIAGGVGAASVPNRYRLIAWHDDGTTPELIPFSDAASFRAALAGLGPATESLEDAYLGISGAITGSAWRASAFVSRTICFLTDEPRNDELYLSGAGGQLNDFLGIKTEVRDGNYVLVGVCGQAGGFLRDSLNIQVLGYDYTRKTYKEDGSGGFVNGTGGNIIPAPVGNTVFPISTADAYETLLMDSEVNGYIFDIYRLRLGAPDVQASFVVSMASAMSDAISVSLQWTLTGWYDVDGNLLSAANPYTFPVTETKTVVARFEPLFS